ncbi:hypothetical protein RSOLAG22IIIB_02539 [Rhizoctonia solani]|uniref:Uncharacterized protein n=1 Tax=Rhizoctonia solani TaxID=456999 RepID=A0A0K6GGP3_9AGAM|nr:unnamed protein product [Rhizoctonia solani]CUA77524.1 hypothetical protein RSOLAG22IIIB_02539 [Rhizoctonia solani]
MAPTFTIYQDPPVVSQPPVSSKLPLTQPSSARSSNRPASCSTSLLARDVDKENVDPASGKGRATTTKSKNKKSLSSKNKDMPSKSSSKVPKVSRSAAPGPAKSGKAARISPYPDPAMPSFMSELSFNLTGSVEQPTPCLITGFSASSLCDFAEPDFDLQSDFVQQPSPTRAAPVVATSSLWTSLSSQTPEIDSDQKARDLTELPLADLSEAFAIGVSNGTKKSTCQNKATMPNEFTLSFLDESMSCLPPTLHTTPRFERRYALIAEFDSDVSVF